MINRVEVDDKHLKRDPSMRFTFFDGFSRIIRRMEDIDEARLRRVIREFPSGYVAPTGLEMFAALLSRTSQFAGSAAEAHLEQHKLVCLQKVSRSWEIGCSESCGARVLMGVQQS